MDAVWEVPVARNAHEWEWLREAARVAPGSVPPLIAHDLESGCFVMRFLTPETHPCWKDQLRRGHVDERTARAVGQRLVTIHNATADRTDLRVRFATDQIFHAIRLEPYLLATARRHPDLGDRLRALFTRTAHTKRTLVHGDVSPKNILVGPDGPIFLDAECAWYGDPAFDLAFCLTHLLLKCLWTPSAWRGFVRAFDTLADAYLTGVGWEDRSAIEEARGTASAGAVAGTRRRKVAGRVCDGRNRPRARAASRATPADRPCLDVVGRSDRLVS